MNDDYWKLFFPMSVPTTRVTWQMAICTYKQPKFRLFNNYLSNTNNLRHAGFINYLIFYHWFWRRGERYRKTIRYVTNNTTNHTCWEIISVRFCSFSEYYTRYRTGFWKLSKLNDQIQFCFLNRFPTGASIHEHVKSRK